MLKNILRIVFLLFTGLLLYSCASSNMASYHYVSKQLEHEDLNFHRTIHINEYINAFDQPEIEVPDSKIITLQVDPFYSEQSIEMNRSLIQVAVKTGVADSLSKKLNVSLCFVLDVSGSMGFDNKLEDAKKALLSAVSVMKNGDEFTLVVFSNDAQTIIEPQILNQENRIQIMEIIRGLKEQGGTNIQAGLLQGYFELTKFKNREYSRLLLLTDGNSNIDIVTPEQLAKKLNVEYVEGLRISTIGLGYDVNQELLRKIAKNGGGHYYFVD